MQAEVDAVVIRCGVVLGEAHELEPVEPLECDEAAIRGDIDIEFMDGGEAAFGVAYVEEAASALRVESDGKSIQGREGDALHVLGGLAEGESEPAAQVTDLQRRTVSLVSQEAAVGRDRAAMFPGQLHDEPDIAAVARIDVPPLDEHGLSIVCHVRSRV
ncbi:MAG TPA: hypothetical protein VN680_03380, partial [Burkholderiaceae bacterium]|nr:hypothetical protein [Burkholderiaceae bacterium]